MISHWIILEMHLWSLLSGVWKLHLSYTIYYQTLLTQSKAWKTGFAKEKNLPAVNPDTVKHLHWVLYLSQGPLARGGQKAATVTSWGSCYQSSGDNSSHIWWQRSHICSGCVGPMHCCDAACWPGDIFGKGMAFSKMMRWKRRALAVCVHPLLSGCSAWLWPGSLLGTDLSMGCLPHFLGKEGACGTFHEVPWHREAPDTGWGPPHAESSLSPVSSAVLESDMGKSLRGFIYKENKKKSQPQCCTMGSMEKTLPWANWVFELIFSVLFVFKIVHIQASGPGHWASWAIQPPALLRTFFWVYKESLLKQYTTISINRKGIPLP